MGLGDQFLSSTTEPTDDTVAKKEAMKPDPWGDDVVRLHSAKSIAQAFGVSDSAICKMRRNKWFPKRPEGGWVLEDLRQLIIANAPRSRLAERASQHQSQSGFEASPKEALKPSKASNEALKILSSADATALDRARAATLMQSHAFAAAAKTGRVTQMQSRALKQALEEQRRCEAAWIDIALKRGELIPRAKAAEVIGSLAARGVRVLDAVEVELATQIEIWMSDTDFAKCPTSDRKMIVRKWFRRMSRSAREHSIREIDEMISDEK